ncbi:MAG: AzlC family ABC transporter permease [Alcaligenaceae bacterium]|nr:AzlC family ABC transporter permease [Alcaligenaceae bacterium]
MVRQHHELTRQESWVAFKEMLPVAAFVAIFGVAFGLASIQTGLDGLSTVMMSALVFGGASQFAALELWGEHVPVVPLIATVFFINARHILMGASVYPWFKDIPLSKRYSYLLVISDANWAKGQIKYNEGKSGLADIVGGGLALWLMWVLGSWLGLYFGYLIQNPRALGLDMVMYCFLLTMVLSGPKNIRIVFIWLISAIVSVLAYWYLPDNMHVVVGALAGGLVGLAWKERVKP